MPGRRSLSSPVATPASAGGQGSVAAPSPVGGPSPVDGAVTADLAEQVADVMFALSTPGRVQILGCLLAGPATVGQLVEGLGVEQSALSHQLRVLREHDLVRADRVGRHRVYSLADDEVAALLEHALRHVTSHTVRTERARGLPAGG